MRSAPLTSSRTRCRWRKVGPKLCVSRSSNAAGPGTCRLVISMTQPGTAHGGVIGRTCQSSFSKTGCTPSSSFRQIAQSVMVLPLTRPGAEENGVDWARREASMHRLFHSLVVCGAGLTLAHCGGKSTGDGDGDE